MKVGQSWLRILKVKVKGNIEMPAKKPLILTADDDLQILRLVARNLQLEGYEVVTATDGAQALEHFETQRFDLGILDVMMPKFDGFTVLARVREFSSVPIIMVTARGQDQDKIRGLDLGADDYLTKPFSVEELLARVRSVMRRSQFAAIQEGQNVRPVVALGDLTIDFAQHRVTVSGQEVELTPIEYRLLAYLAQNTGRVITQDLLLEHVWGEEYAGESHLLQVNMNRLRHKIEQDPAHPRYLLTKMGVGYLIAAQPVSSS
jgi:DNA-binding response OmpR family regulator